MRALRSIAELFASFLLRVRCAWRYAATKRELQHNHARAIEMAIIKAALTLRPKDEPFPPYPEQAGNVSDFKRRARLVATKPPRRFVFSDSFAAFLADDLELVFPKLFNFGQPGNGWPGFAATAEALRPYTGEAEALLVGCGGNGALYGQTINRLLNEQRNGLDRIRAAYPVAKILIYGWPPVYDLYTASIAPIVEADAEIWTKADHNAVFLPLQKHFAGLFGIFPRLAYSSDGVHAGPYGAARFVSLVKRALQAPPGSRID